MDIQRPGAMSKLPGGPPISFLLVSHSYPPVIGGSELEAQRICAALMRRGHRVQVVCAGGNPMPPVRDWIDPMGVPVRIYDGRWEGASKDRVFALRVAGMLIRERKNYDLVYFLMQGLHLAAGLPAARFLRKPILMKIGGSGVIPLMSRSHWGRLELRWLRRWAHRVMILNEGMREEALREGFAKEQLLWMPNPVDTVEFSPCDEQERAHLRDERGIPAAAPVVVYSGRLAPEKALPTLIAAFAEVARRKPEAMLLLVGNGPVRAALERQAGALGLENVRFAGGVEPGEVRSWLRVADVFALVSLSEGFPCALAEAMAVGLPAVVSDIPATRQLVDHEQHGLLAPVGDERAISASILRLLDNAGLRARMGEAARARIVENYSTEKVADRYEALFQDAMASASGGR
jgi:glycosyltransferase involved in cell wall biosynthesis